MKRKALLTTLIFATLLLCLTACGCATVESITVVSNPDKTDYIVGEALDLTGGTIEINYSNGFKIGLDMIYVSVTGFDSSTPRDLDLTVTYLGISATFKVTVANGPVIGFEIFDMPEKISYFIGETLDLTGGTVAITYDNVGDDGMTVFPMDYSGFTTIYDFSEEGERTVKLEYENFSVEFYVTVSNPYEEMPSEVEGILNHYLDNILFNRMFGYTNTVEHFLALSDFIKMIDDIAGDLAMIAWIKMIQVNYISLSMELYQISLYEAYLSCINDYNVLLYSQMPESHGFFSETLLPFYKKWIAAGGSSKINGVFCDRGLYPGFDDDVEALLLQIDAELDEYTKAELIMSGVNLNAFRRLSMDHYGYILEEYGAMAYEYLYNAKSYYYYFSLGLADLAYFFGEMENAKMLYEYFGATFAGYYCQTEYENFLAIYNENFMVAPQGFDWTTFNYVLDALYYSTGNIATILNFANIYYTYAVTLVEYIYFSENAEWIKYYELMYIRRVASYENYLNEVLYSLSPEMRDDPDLFAFLLSLAAVYTTEDFSPSDMEELIGLYSTLDAAQITAFVKTETLYLPFIYASLCAQYYADLVSSEVADLYVELILAEMCYIAWDYAELYYDDFIEQMEYIIQAYEDLTTEDQNMFISMFGELYYELLTNYFNLIQ